MNAVRTLLHRMFRASILDPNLYEEVEADRSSISQATIVVLLTCLAGSLGSYLTDRSPTVVIIDFLEPLVFWLAGGAFTYMVGATFLRGPHTATSYREVLRTTGFAFSPGLLRVAIALPLYGVGFGVTVLSDLWVLVAGIVAVRQALDFTTLRAVGTFGLSYALLWLTFEGVLLELARLPF